MRDYAAVLLEALTQQRTLEDAMRDLPLPAPFEQIVRKGISGEWGLEQIGAALKSTTTTAQPPVAPLPAAVAEARVERPVVAPVVAPPLVARRIQVPVNDEPRGVGMRGIAYGVGTLLILLLGWYFVHSRAASSNGAGRGRQHLRQVALQSVPAAADESGCGKCCGRVLPR